MVAKYQKEHEVAYYECDINQTMTFPAMLGVAQPGRHVPGHLAVAVEQSKRL